LLPLKTRWEKDLGEELWDDTWESVLHRVHSSSFSARHSLIQFKVVHHIHWSGDKLWRIFSDFDSTCVRCKTEPATLFHIFWDCHKLSGFWELIFKCFSDMTLLYIRLPL
jgi:hypothetical protein